MDATAPIRPRRSMLFVPGNNAKALKKAPDLDCDGIIIDLEDAVGPSDKVKAREAALEAVDSGFDGKETLVRINGVDSPWHHDDIEALGGACVHGLVVPKVQSAAEIYALNDAMTEAGAPDEMAIWAMIETPLGVLRADEIAATSARLAGFLLGLEDLSKALNANRDSDRNQVSYALQRVVMAARAYDLIALDSPTLAYKDEAQCQAEAQQARAIGYDGKCAIHPSQIATINQAFSPTKAELEDAKRIIDAFESAQSAGQGIATLDGKLIEAMHVEAATKLALMERAINGR